MHAMALTFMKSTPRSMPITLAVAAESPAIAVATAKRVARKPTLILRARDSWYQPSLRVL